MNTTSDTLPTAAAPVGAPVAVPAGATGAIPVPAGAPPVVEPPADVPNEAGSVPLAPEQTGAAPEVVEGDAPVTDPVLPPGPATEDMTPAEIVGRHLDTDTTASTSDTAAVNEPVTGASPEPQQSEDASSTPTASTPSLPAGVSVGAPEPSSPQTLGEQPSLEQRVSDLEAYVARLEKASQDGLAGALQTIAGIGNQLNGVQQNIAALANGLGQMAARVNQLDPKRPVLQVTYCQYEPTQTLEGIPQIAFKATVHNDSHPEKPGQLDALMLNTQDANNVHWAPVNITPELGGFIKEGLAEQGYPNEQWVWVRLREMPREPGSDLSINFSYGTDDTTPPEAVVATEDESATSAETQSEQA